MQEEIDKVTTEIEKVESGNTKYYSVDELKDWLGLRKKRRAPAEDELMKNIVWAVANYNQYSEKKALRAILNNIEIIDA